MQNSWDVDTGPIEVDAMLAAITPKYELECAEFTTLAMSVCEELAAQSKSDDTVRSFCALLFPSLPPKRSGRAGPFLYFFLAPFFFCSTFPLY